MNYRKVTEESWISHIGPVGEPAEHAGQGLGKKKNPATYSAYLKGHCSQMSEKLPEHLLNQTA